jgi:hypothetical protein
MLLGQASFSAAQTVLIDFGSDTSFRGLSVNNPDSNGNYWNSVQPGLLVSNLFDIDNGPTTIDLGWDTPVGTDSYNGPAGPTDEMTLETDVQNTFIDAAALGNLGGALEAAFDFAAGYDGINHFPVRFQIQGLNAAATYNLTFFGSHSFSNDATTVYTVYSDDTYTTPVATTTLLIQEPFFEPNRDRIATINNVSPQADNILYIQFLGETGKGGYLNALQLEGSAPPLSGDYDDNGQVNGADLSVWKTDFGKVQAGLMADGDGDGDADGADFLIWQRNLGAPAAVASAAAIIPEPAALALLLVGATALPATRRRRA